MLTRIITGIFLIIIVVFGILNLNQCNFTWVSFLLVAWSAWEYKQFISGKVRKYLCWFVPFIIILSALSSFISLYVLMIVSVLSWSVFIFLIFSYQKIYKTFYGEVSVIFGVVLLVPFWAALVYVHNLNPWLLLFLILVVSSADTGAYFAGKFFGKRKIVPNISPNKTYVGLFGGMALSSVIGMLFVVILHFSIGLQNFPNTFMLIILTPLIAFLSFFGDLFESLLKRMNNIKDSGKSLPGHGGILDRIDGFLIAVPALAIISLLF